MQRWKTAMHTHQHGRELIKVDGTRAIHVKLLKHLQRTPNAV